ncbi:MAG TPA: HPr family phosphocarrier protein [Phycisphaerae bacterium]|nr:HPr family phosphocarrier protein [Phycisphaerae bacterium]
MQGNSAHVEIEVVISNQQGLHARPVMKFVDTAARFPCEIHVVKGPLSVDAKSPMEMMLLEAVRGTVLKLVAKGTEAQKALDALADLVNSKFGED